MDSPESKESLREVIAWAKREAYECERTKSVKKLKNARISHRFANALGNDLEEEGISVLWRKGGNANYFVAEIEGRKGYVSVFASQVQWWEKPTEVFLSTARTAMTKDHTCRWGVALFSLPVCDGVWIESAEYEKSFEWPKKLHESDVTQAINKKAALKFSNPVDLINVVRKWPGARRKLYKRD